MPKNKKKAQSKPGGIKSVVETGNSDDEGSVFNDAASVDSFAGSEASTVRGGDNSGGEDGAVDESSQLEVFEGKMKDAIDLAGQKSAGGRVKALEALCSGFLKRYCPDFAEGRQMTFCDLVERSLKKGKGAEVVSGSRLGVLLALQLPDSEEVYKELRGLMGQIANDKTASPASRVAVVDSLVGLCFLGGGEMAEVVSTMTTLETIFSNSFLKKDGTLPTPSPDQQALHCSALAGWCLLLTLQTSGEVFRIANRSIQNLSGLLGSSDVDLRITAGEAIALILEFAYDYDEEYEPDQLMNLIEILKNLATDCSKSRSKKDRKEQRSSFRDVLKGVEEGDCPSENVKFGREVVRLDCWYKKIQYNWFCKVLGSGMNLHLQSNYMLREIFELGAPLPIFDVNSASKQSKSERNAANQLAFKHRTQSRGKNRDKRSAVF